MPQKSELLHCSGCKQYKPKDDFYSKSKHSRYSRCLECRRNYSREWMRAHRDVPHGRIWSALHVAYGRRCVRCGYYEFDAPLEFAFIGPKKKQRGKTQLANLVNRYAYSPNDPAWDALIDALSSRVLLCANCTVALRAGQWTWEELLEQRPALRKGPRQPVVRPYPAPSEAPSE